MTFLEEIKKPFNIITLTLAIVSIALSVVFYCNGKKEKNLSFQLTEPTSLIFDNRNSSSKIKVFEKDSVLITDNIYLLSGSIWNSGDIPIIKSDVRKALTVDLAGAKRILDYKLVKQKDVTIANFKIEKIKDNSLTIDWDYFDPGFGFTFQIIYIGSEDPKFNLSGKVLDIGNFSEVKQSQKSDMKVIFILVSYPLIIIFLLWEIYKCRHLSGTIDKRYVVMLILSVVVLIYEVSILLINKDVPI